SEDEQLPVNDSAAIAKQVIVRRFKNNKRGRTSRSTAPNRKRNVRRLSGEKYMVLSSSLTTRLLGAIETDSLIFLCGAGLSIADLLISRGAHADLSANFDSMIESWAEERKIAMRGALTGQEAVTFNNTGPLIKFHGCLHRDRERTLWTQGQLAESVVQARVAS